MRLANRDKNIITAHDEKELLLRITRGDQPAFTEFVRRRWNTIYSHCLAYLRSAQRAEEVTQDIFLKVWLNREKLGEARSPEDYLFILARNHLVNETRKRIDQLYGQPSAAEVSTTLTPDLQTEYRESYRLLLKGIELLPEKRRLVFKMSRLEGMSNERISAELGMHKDTVYQYIAKALIFLKTYLREHSDDTALVILLLASMRK